MKINYIFYHSLVLVTLRYKILILLCMREMARKSHSVNFKLIKEKNYES